jgi:hypothetical protein
VTAIALAGLTVAYQLGRPAPTDPVVAELPAPQWPVMPFVPVPIESSPVPDWTATVAPATVPGGVRERRLGWSGGTTAPRSPSSTPAKTPATTTPAATTPAPAPSFVVGAVIGLEPVGQPGYRVRHRDFRGRVDRIGPASSSLDRADSRFVVRAGRADPACVSLESVNYPGYFLRHQDFVLKLQRGDGSRLFAADATFCPVPAPSGSTLRSVNYPDRYWAEWGSSLVLSSRNPAAFAVRPPL